MLFQVIKYRDGSLTGHHANVTLSICQPRYMPVRPFVGEFERRCFALYRYLLPTLLPPRYDLCSLSRMVPIRKTDECKTAGEYLSIPVRMEDSDRECVLADDADRVGSYIRPKIVVCRLPTDTQEEKGKSWSSFFYL